VQRLLLGSLFFAESVRQPRESADRHAHREILAFDKASRDVIGVGASVNDLGYNLRESRWGVPRVGAIVLSVIPEQFHKLERNRISDTTNPRGSVLNVRLWTLSRFRGAGLGFRETAFLAFHCPDWQIVAESMMGNTREHPKC
jgi:hypothetical protein